MSEKALPLLVTRYLLLQNLCKRVAWSRLAGSACKLQILFPFMHIANIGISFQSYTAATFLLFETAQRLLEGFPKRYALASLSVAKEALQALSACSTCDDIAKRLLSALMTYDKFLSAELGVPSGGSQPAPSLQGSPYTMEQSNIPLGYLLRQRGDDVDLCRVAKDLLRLLCHPMDGIKGLECKAGLSPPLWSECKGSLEEVSLGCHLEWVSGELESC